jgi:hypothetical protein
MRDEVRKYLLDVRESLDLVAAFAVATDEQRDEIAPIPEGVLRGIHLPTG